MRILFWNVMRLGFTTDDARRTVINKLLHDYAPNYVMLCEITTASIYPEAQNITYRIINPQQLCYGSFDANGTTNVLTRVVPPAVPAYTALGFPGGNDFKELVNRALASAGNIGGCEVYVFHAPANNAFATRAITFLTYSLNATHGANPWLVIGDFNVEPVTLSPFVQGFIKSGGGTFITVVPTREYDYVLTNSPGAINEFIVGNPGAPGSDHLPIIINY